MGSELIFEGKKYISAIRASSISGYNSDYIGQLCRKNLIDCRRVGRSWFVSEESLHTHKATASLTPRGRIPMYQKNSDVRAGFNSAGAGIATMPSPIANPLGFNFSPEMAYKSFHQAAVNFLDRREEKRQADAFTRKIIGGVAVVMLLMVFVVPGVMGGNSGLSFLSQINLGAAQAGVLSTQVSGSVAHIKSYRAELLSSVVYSSQIFSNIGESMDRGMSHVVNGVHSRFTRISGFLAVASQKFGFWSEDGKNRDRDGFVVVPSGSDEVNAKVKEYVENNFSDETEVVADETGNSGLIKPVFKNESDQEYVYVMVPVKEADGP